MLLASSDKIYFTRFFGSNDNPEQQWLGEKSGSTTTLGSGEDPYTHFPTGTEYPQDYEGSDGPQNTYQENRHPVDVFQYGG
ncbi:MAG: hypothetical protein ACI9LV_000179 [Candidatus Nanohaloarchaea archaeon]